MNTWHPFLSSCSTPEENQHTGETRILPRTDPASGNDQHHHPQGDDDEADCKRESRFVVYEHEDYNAGCDFYHHEHDFPGGRTGRPWTREGQERGPRAPGPWPRRAPLNRIGVVETKQPCRAALSDLLG